METTQPDQMNDADEIQYEQTVRQFWRDPEFEAWLDRLEEQRKAEDESR